MKYYYVYIVSNWNHYVFYTGFADDLCRRTVEHRLKIYRGFTSKYNCFKLLYFEIYHEINDAKHRERQLKRYRRNWKENLIKSINPTYKDLFFDVKD